MVDWLSKKKKGVARGVLAENLIEFSLNSNRPAAGHGSEGCRLRGLAVEAASDPVSKLSDRLSQNLLYLPYKIPQKPLAGPKNFPRLRRVLILGPANGVFNSAASQNLPYFPYKMAPRS